MSKDKQSKIKLARMLFPVKTLGPGNRIGIWLYGCPRRCTGCANPELWEMPDGGEVDLQVIRKAVEQIVESREMPEIDGVTISGGEPFFQPEALQEMVEYFGTITEDILIFTGYKRADLANYDDKILSKIGVLVDGEYVQEENYAHPLKGSDNQCIFYLNKTLKERYERYIEEGKALPKVQLFPVIGGQIVSGIHKADFEEQLEERLKKDLRVKNGRKHDD